jgi:hypothetical protein
MDEPLKMVMIQPRHLGEIDHLHDVQERVLGEEVDRPLVLKEPVLIAIGFEDAEKLKGGFYIEATAELCFFGVDPDSTDAAIANCEPVFDFLRSRGIRWLRCVVPKAGGLADQLQGKFDAAGMDRVDEKFAVFTKDLRR